MNVSDFIVERLQEAHHVIDRFTVNRQARIAMLLKCLSQCDQGTVAGNRCDGGSRHHSLAHQCVGKLKHPMNQTSFFRTQMPTLTRKIDELPQLCFSVT